MDRITQPGIYNIEEAAYHADPCPAPSLSRTTAHILLTQTAAHAHFSHPRLGGGGGRTSDSFDLGTAAHSYFLGTGRGVQVVKKPNGDPYATWASGAQQKAMDIRAAGGVPMLDKDHDRVLAMVAALHDWLRHHPVLGGRYSGGYAERTIVWREDTPYGPIWCRCMIDWLNGDASAPLALDLKTVTSADPLDFQNKASDYGYGLQAAFYRRGYRAITGLDPEFYFLAVEKAKPHLCCAFVSDWDEVAERQVEKAIHRWAYCLHNDDWPGYPLDIVPFRPSRSWEWRMRDCDETLGAISGLTPERAALVVGSYAPERQLEFVP
jgi:hypothetical protein